MYREKHPEVKLSQKLPNTIAIIVTVSEVVKSNGLRRKGQIDFSYYNFQT